MATDLALMANLSTCVPQKSDRLYQVSVGQCLSVTQPVGPKGYVTMAICDASPQQKWQLMG